MPRKHHKRKEVIKTRPEFRELRVRLDRKFVSNYFQERDLEARQNRIGEEPMNNAREPEIPSPMKDNLNLLVLELKKDCSLITDITELETQCAISQFCTSNRFTLDETVLAINLCCKLTQSLHSVVKSRNTQLSHAMEKSGVHEARGNCKESDMRKNRSKKR